MFRRTRFISRHDVSRRGRAASAHSTRSPPRTAKAREEQHAKVWQTAQSLTWWARFRGTSVGRRVQGVPRMLAKAHPSVDRLAHRTCLKDAPAIAETSRVPHRRPCEGGPEPAATRAWDRPDVVDPDHARMVEGHRRPDRLPVQGAEVAPPGQTPLEPQARLEAGEARMPPRRARQRDP